MPNYDYRCTGDCKAEWELNLPMAEMMEPTTIPCPICGGVIEKFLAYAPGFAYDHLNIRKRVPETFKDVLRNIKSKHLHNTIDV